MFGFEIENVQGGEYANNLAECNTGGFLIYDLDGLRQYAGFATAEESNSVRILQYRVRHVLVHWVPGSYNFV